MMHGQKNIKKKNQKLYSYPSRIFSVHHKRCVWSFVLLSEIHILYVTDTRWKCCSLPLLLHIGVFHLGICLFDITWELYWKNETYRALYTLS